MDVHYRLADRVVEAAGMRLGTPGPGLGQLTLAPGEAAKLRNPAGGWTVDGDGVLTALPLPPPPATRPRTQAEWRALFAPLEQDYQAAEAAFRAALPNVPAGATRTAITQLGIATDKLHQTLVIVAKALFLAPDPADHVPNTDA